MLYSFQEKESGNLCSQEKETGPLLFSRKRKPMFYCSCFQEKGISAILFSGEVVLYQVYWLTVMKLKSRQ